MNRTIKFRVWEPDSKTMYLQAMVGEPANPSVWTKANWRECTENVVIMQFTGLTDKNGKEIYEGDVVQLIGFADRYIIDYDNGQFYQEGIEPGTHDITFSSQGSNKLEVIGNIYENSNLLKESK